MPWIKFEDGTYHVKELSILGLYNFRKKLFLDYMIHEFNPKFRPRSHYERLETIKGRYQLISRDLQSNLRKTSRLGTSTMEHRCKQSISRIIQNNVWTEKEIQKDKEAEFEELSFIDLFHRHRP